MGRDPKHDYRSRCIYHITIGKAPTCPAFSQIGGSLEQPLVVRSRLGELIESQILNFPNLCPLLQPLQYVIMPDHIHFLLFAREYNPFKAPVIIHRVDSVALRADKQRRWKHLAENGGVLVSPFISPEEKAIRNQCENAGGRLCHRIDLLSSF